MRHAITTAFALSLLGCAESPTSGDPLSLVLPLREQTFSGSIVTVRRIAAIDTQYLAVPSRATAGDSLEVVLPVAAGGCAGSDTTIAQVDERVITIWPYQRRAVNLACAAIYIVERRTVRVNVQAQGDVRLRIVTRNGPEGAFRVLERRVTVE